MRVVGISGSLQARSSNTALLHALRDIAHDVGVDVVVFDRVGEIPALNPDVADDHAPGAVAELRALVAGADAVVIATPEYAHGVPGLLKNALDWLVGSGELYGTPVAILSAAPSADRAHHARGDLERTLRAQGADVRSSCTVATRLQVGDQLDDGARAALVAAIRSLS